MRKPGLLLLGLVLLLVLAGCAAGVPQEQAGRRAAALVQPECDPDNGGLQLPDGFCALVVADVGERARHLVVDADGDLYVALRQVRDGGGIVALRDTSGDGRMDIVRHFGEYGGTGIDLYDGYLYFASDSAVLRYPLRGDELVPSRPPQVVVRDLAEQGSHASKPFTFDDEGWMYVNIGAPSNACQEQDRTMGSPGQDPCPMLERFGGIWRFRADRTGQTQDSGERFATGIRNAVALDWSPAADNLYVVQHGRDMLYQLYADLFTAEESAEIPAEEFFLVNRGDDFGWPYCYYDPVQNRKVLAPEYGGNGEEVGRCASAEDPIMAFPGHYAPNDLLFYTGGAFPERYRDGAFIAFHGSWNRGPLPQRGYNVGFVPFDGERPSGAWEVFADGFAGAETLASPNDARHRPMGLAQGPDGSLYITDSQRGRIWRVLYKG